MIELLILYILSSKELTMYAIQKKIVDDFGAYTNPSFGAVKPALTRLENQGHLRSRKQMSDGGKLSGFYSITKTGEEELKKLLLAKLSKNPLQFFSSVRIKLTCSDVLVDSDRKELFDMLKTIAYEHKYNAESRLADEYNSVNFYQRVTLDNTVVELNNLISLIEGLEKELK